VSDLVAGEIRAMAGPAALPRVNGELVFDAPWEGRALGLAIAVTDNLGVGWDRFRLQLVRALADRPNRPYYESWVAALEALVVAEGVATADELRARSAG